ncbi:MAG: NADH-quinone oxidoreductase subunit D [Elusimicrobiota bacterium]|jgi:NADH-quinone oxidoreductase subunit D
MTNVSLPKIAAEVFPQQPPEKGMFISLGPQHPSTHGVLRVAITADGEVITSAQPDIGYLHRATEKLAEKRTYQQIIVLTDRLDYLAAMTNNWAYCLAVEKMLSAQVPERAEYLRIIVGELQRIASHCVFLGTYAIDLGAVTPFLIAFGREREKILDLFEEISGARLTYNYIRIGGLMADAPDGWLDKVRAFAREMPGHIDEYDTLLTNNPIFVDRTRNIGSMTPETAIAWGLTGPNLRATGCKADVRKDDPYGLYSKINFNIPVGKQGDCLDRYWVRIQEMRESVKIILQALDQIQPGETMAKIPKNFRVPLGEGYGHLEAPRGDLGFYIVSDGTPSPYRMFIRSPSFNNLQALQQLLKGWKVADVISILGSVDIVLGEVDR